MSRHIEIELSRDVPRELMDDVEDKLRYAAAGLRSFRLDPSRPRSLSLEIDPDAPGEEIAAKARKLVESMIAGWRPAPVKLRYDGRHRTPPYEGDPWQDLLARGEVLPLSAGHVALGGLPLVMLRSFERIFAELGAELGGSELRYPPMIAVKDLERCQYFSSFPHHVTFASHLREDVDVLTAFARARDHAEGYPWEQGLRPPPYVLNPAVCFHTFSSLGGQSLPGPRTVTTSGSCFRYESTAMTSLERLWSFTMREIIFIGEPEWVRARREVTIEALTRLVERLGLCAHIETANDPFFLTNFVAKKYHQLLTDAKFELRLALPHAGKSLAVASFNYHEDFFGRSYGIQLDNKSAHTGCTAFGLERWVWAVLSQYGADPSLWPAVVRDLLVN